MSTPAECDICAFLPRIPEELILAKNELAIANLRVDTQRLLGSCVVSVIDHVPEIDYLTPEASWAFTTMQSTVVTALRKAFDTPPLYFNILNLKNGAYAGLETDPLRSHLHAHIWPRWKEVQMITAGIGEQTVVDTFDDPCPGQEYCSADYPPKIVHPAIAAEIAARIRHSLPPNYANI